MEPQALIVREPVEVVEHRTVESFSGASDEDRQFIEFWLYGRPQSTRRVYEYAVALLLSHAKKPLAEIGWNELHQFSTALSDLAPATQAKLISAVRSLFKKANTMRYLEHNLAVGLAVPRPEDTLGSRILAERDVLRMIALTEEPRDHTLLCVLFGAGVRRAEISGVHRWVRQADGSVGRAWVGGLRWRSLQERGKAGQITVLGKGNKTRTILLSPETWAKLSALRPDHAAPDDPVFLSQKHSPLSGQRILEIVAEAAERAGIPKHVTPHFLRHAHVTSALNHGAKPHVVQRTVGHASLATTTRYSDVAPDESSALFLPV